MLEVEKCPHVADSQNMEEIGVGWWEFLVCFYLIPQFQPKNRNPPPLLTRSSIKLTIILIWDKII